MIKYTKDVDKKTDVVTLTDPLSSLEILDNLFTTALIETSVI